MNLMHRKKRSSLSRYAALALSLTVLLTGCRGGYTGAASSNGWVDSDLIGSVKAEDTIRIQDDFAAAANREWILKGGSRGVLYDITGKVAANKRALLSDTSLKGKDIGEVRKFIELAEDWDKRNRLGVKPLRKYLERIESISDIDGYYRWLCSPEENPLDASPLPVRYVRQSLADPAAYLADLGPCDLSLKSPDSYFKYTADTVAIQQSVTNKVTYIMDRLGYKPSEIKRILADCFRIEKRFARESTPLTADDQRVLSYSREDLREASGSYPLLEYLDARGFKNTQRYMMDIGYVRQLHNICTDAGLSALKAKMMVDYILYAGRYLDRDALDKFTAEDAGGSQPEDESDIPSPVAVEDALIDVYLRSAPIIRAALDKVYTAKYTDDAGYDRLLKMTEEIIETYRDIFRNEDWMSKEGRKLCIEKLDALKIHIIYPDFDNLDLSDMNIIPSSEGGTFLDAQFESIRMYTRRMALQSTVPFDRNYWDPCTLSTSETNAMYSPDSNGIYIFTGILEDPVYFPGISDEELLGGIGVIVGHEITHGFDSEGTRYNKDGLEMQWMPQDDIQAFLDKCDTVSHYYTTIMPYQGSGLYNGEQVNGEATADMGGLRVTLKMAEDMPGFDYDKYFRAYARFFTAQTTIENEEQLFKTDVHPLNFLRINVGLQQFDEFYETYDVRPGDKMYLKKDERIAVW